MKKILISLSIIFLWLGCQSGQSEKSTQFPQIYDSQTQIELNTSSPYLINSISGDSIHSIITAYGDTVITGKYFSIPSFRTLQTDPTITPLPTNLVSTESPLYKTNRSF